MNKILIAVIVVIAVIAVGAYFFLFSSSGPVELPVDLEAQQAEQNTGLYAALYSGGIQDPFVNIDETQAYVAYELPDGFDSDSMQKFVLGEAASAAPNSPKLVAVQYENEVAKSMWTVDTPAYDDWIAGKITDEQFDAKIEKKAL